MLGPEQIAREQALGLGDDAGAFAGVGLFEREGEQAVAGFGGDAQAEAETVGGVDVERLA